MITTVNSYIIKQSFTSSFSCLAFSFITYTANTLITDCISHRICHLQFSESHQNLVYIPPVFTFTASILVMNTINSPQNVILSMDRNNYRLALYSDV